jgi:hypothetical protein
MENGCTRKTGQIFFAHKKFESDSSRPPFQLAGAFPYKNRVNLFHYLYILIISDAPARIKFQTIQFHPSRAEITGIRNHFPAAGEDFRQNLGKIRMDRISEDNLNVKRRTFGK